MTDGTKTEAPGHTLDSPEMSALLASCLAVFSIGPDHVVALDEDDAWRIWCEQYGERRENYADEPCTREDDDQELTIYVDEQGRCSDSGDLLTLTANVGHVWRWCEGEVFNQFTDRDAAIADAWARWALRIPKNQPTWKQSLDLAPCVLTERTLAREDFGGDSPSIPKSFTEQEAARAHTLVASLPTRLDLVYRKRNAIACALALAVLAAGGRAGVTTDPQGEDGFRLAVVVMLPTGRVGWHLDESDPARPWQALPEFREPWESFTDEEGARRLREFLSEDLPRRERFGDWRCPVVDALHTEVERLDRTQPPPGYRSWTYRGTQVGGVLYESPDGEQVGPLAAAWAHCERWENPPGMWRGRHVSDDGARETWSYGVGDESRPRRAGFAVALDARAAAWAYYWRLVALAAALDTYGWYDQRRSGPWPRVLKWTDEQVEEVEKWLAWHTTKGQKVSKNPALPEVFRV